MIRSMTGYAQSQNQNGRWTMVVTVRALNHRYLDLHLRLPGELDPVEQRLKKLVRSRIKRGHLEVQARIEREEGKTMAVNRELVRSFLEAYAELQKEHKVKSEPDLTAVLRMPGVLRVTVEELTPDALEELARLAEETLADALERLDDMRATEGAALAEEFRGRVDRIRASRVKLAELCEKALPARQRQLESRLRELLEDAKVDPVRLAEEAAYRAERGDVSEELTRLESHLSQFCEILEGGAEVGKRLDFLLQEMNRESNTILSKTPGLGEDGLEMTRQGLDMKAEIERLREQVQNVE